MLLYVVAVSIGGEAVRRPCWCRWAALKGLAPAAADGELRGDECTRVCGCMDVLRGRVYLFN